MCRASIGFWDTPISEQSLLICTVPAVDTTTDETIDGPMRVTWASKATYSACGGSDPVVAWLDMGPSAPRRVPRSQLPYDSAAARQSATRCNELASSSQALNFVIRSYNSTTTKGDIVNDGSLSIFVLPANYFGLIQQAIYSAGTIAAGFTVYDGGFGSSPLF